MLGKYWKRKADLDLSFCSESSGIFGFSPTWTALKRRFF
jgi:hypothetical protein